VIRRFTDSDLDPLAAILAQPGVARWWDDYDKRDLAREIRRATLAWTIEVDGRPAGMVLAHEEPDPDYRQVEVDMFLDSALHGQGIGTDALRQALRMLFEGRGHHRATLGTSPENTHAISVYERIGFRRVGLLRRASRGSDGEWHDELLMDLLAEEMR
jgi:aminoglycoside 6'-N-acetyltransferase